MSSISFKFDQSIGEQPSAQPSISSSRKIQNPSVVKSLPSASILSTKSHDLMHSGAPEPDPEPEDPWPEEEPQNVSLWCWISSHSSGRQSFAQSLISESRK